ncbi:MAG: sugar lactone lactonase YvrE [Halieaceae bacterium]|jgi:sugar lactone lactonase YvrE
MSMPREDGRYIGSGAPHVNEQWQLKALTPPSRLFGANGICTGPDGRIYVAQVSGSQISAIDIDSGAIETISPKGGDIVAPDDLVFDHQGNLYATEITEGRVCVRAPNGRTRTVYGDMPCANPIAFHQGRLFAGECRVGGRILELSLNGGAPRVLAEDVPMPNAMEVGPDGMLYFPVMGANEIWRIGLDSGEPEKVAGDLGVPDAVKFDAQGNIVSTQVASGQVLRIDPQTGQRTVLADIAPGLDNLTFVGKRLFVSSISGQINEILAPGEIRSLVPDGFSWPLGLAMGADGQLFVADGPYTYTLRPGAEPQVSGMLFSPGFPGYTRGVAFSGPGEFVVTTANGQVARWCPARQESEFLAEGFDQLYGVAITAGGAVVFAERGTGRVLGLESGAVVELANGLDRPSGVAAYGDSCLIAEEGGGRVVKVARGKVETVLDGLRQPQGIVVCGDLLYVVDAGAGELIEYNFVSDSRVTIASNLPLGAPPGVIPKFIDRIGDMAGPAGPFAGIAVGSDDTLYISADADGSILAIRKI